MPGGLLLHFCMSDVRQIFIRTTVIVCCVQYTNKMCWVSYTYYLPDNTVAGQPGAIKQYLSYYQWVPIFLLIQAFLFYLPSVFWRLFSERSGINVHNLVEAADTIQNALYPERRDKTIKYMIRHLDHYLQYQRDYRGGCCACLKACLAHRSCLFCGNRYGNYLLMLYVVTKLLYFANAVSQIFLLDAFLATDYRAYGMEVLVDLATGGRVWGGGRSAVAAANGVVVRRFPRVTLCDFEIRQMGTVHRHTVQCVLPVNLFNEKIYAFLWFWLAGVAAATVVSIARWLWTIAFRYSRIVYIRRHLKVSDRYDRSSDRDRKTATVFTESYLRQDGIFILKLVAKNSTDLVVADIVAALWDNYRQRPFGSRDHAVFFEPDTVEETVDLGFS